MSGERLDPNLMAALLEGQLSPEERARVIAQLNASPEDYAIFVEAAALQGEMEDAAAPAPAALPRAPAAPPRAPLSARRSRWWQPRPWLLAPLAAAVAIIVLAVPFFQRAPGYEDLLALADPAELVTGTGPDAMARELGSDWAYAGWTVTRGGDASTTPDALEFRIGARLADLELALDRGDANAVQAMAGELAALLDQVPGGTAVAQRFAALPQMSSDAAVDSARAALAALLGGSAWLRLGIWTEQARLAALAGNTDYFSQDAMAALRRVARDLPQGGALLAPMETAAAAGDTAAVREAVAALIRTAGG